GPDDDLVARHRVLGQFTLAGSAGHLEGQHADAVWQHRDRLRLPAVELAVEAPLVAVRGNMGQVGQVGRLGVDDGADPRRAGQLDGVDADVRVDLAGRLDVDVLGVVQVAGAVWLDLDGAQGSVRRAQDVAQPPAAASHQQR